MKNYGGSRYDYFNSIVQTADGGYAAVGQSWSSDGDLPGNGGGTDFVIVKFNASSVLPAMFPNDPELDYHALDLIHHGGEAMAAFPAMAQMSKEEQAPLRKALLAYCKLDTLAMVRVLDRLHKSIESSCLTS